MELKDFLNRCWATDHGHDWVPFCFEREKFNYEFKTCSHCGAIVPNTQEVVDEGKSYQK